MFINCKHCGTLVATDPVTDLPPERCPRCRGALRAPDAQATPSVATLLKPVPASAAPAPPTTLPPAPAAPIKPIEPIAPSPAPVAPSQSGEDASASDVAEARAGASVSAAPVDSVPTAAVAPPAPASPSPPELAPMVTVPDRRSPNRLPGPGIPRASPSFVRRMRSGGTGESRRQRHLLIAGVAALSLLLVLQVLLADRARLAGDPAWRPLLTTLCNTLRCSLPPWREPAALTLLARDVRPDPAAPSQLLVSATFRNDARWAQGWPHLRLTLSDIDGRPVGTRMFAPEEYLGDADRADTLAAGRSADVQLVLREPAGHAVSFAFDFI